MNKNKIKMYTFKSNERVGAVNQKNHREQHREESLDGNRFT